jgi:hypothetical protein
VHVLRQDDKFGEMPSQENKHAEHEDETVGRKKKQLFLYWNRLMQMSIYGIIFSLGCRF